MRKVFFISMREEYVAVGPMLGHSSPWVREPCKEGGDEAGRHTLPQLLARSIFWGMLRASESVPWALCSNPFAPRKLCCPDNWGHPASSLTSL